MDISSKITMIDDAFSSYLLNQKDKDLCKDISTIVSAFTKKKFTTSIVNIRGLSKEPFFGMRVFPSESWMDDMCSTITTPNEHISMKDMLERWRMIDEWEIEFDSRVFDRMAINFNPQELTAMLLHEIGHTVYSDQKIEMFYRAYTECRIRMRTADKAASVGLYFLYSIPLSMLCGIRKWSVTSRDLKEEMFADQTVEKLGYAEHLVSAFRKIIKAYGSSTGYSDDTRMESAISQSINWCNINIGDLIKRKNKLKDELYETGAKSNSSYIRSMVTSIMNKLSINQKNRYTGNIVTEAAIDFDDSEWLDKNQLIYNVKDFNALVTRINSIKEMHNNEIATEAFGRKKKPEVPSQLEVDTIFVEVDRIQNHADRKYVLDLIYNQEEKINKFLELCEVNQDLSKKYGSKMNAMLKELDSMRKAVLAKRSFDKQYKVFVKYPAGYEG